MPVSQSIGVDIGGTSLRCSLVNENGDVVWHLKEDNRGQHDRDTLLRQLCHLLDQAREAAGGTPLPIGICVPGFVDYEHQMLGTVFNVPALQGWSLHEELQRRYRVPVRLDNDANMAVLAEARFGAARGCRHLIYITISTSIGAGLILNGVLYRGMAGLAGEIGHLAMDMGDERCYECKTNYSCLTTWCSGNGLAFRARAASEHRSSLASVEKPDARDVCLAAVAGDPFACDTLRNASRALGRAIANLQYTLSFEMIVFGGSVIQNCDMYWDMFKEELDDCLHGDFKRGLRLVRTGLGDGIGALGAAALMMEEEPEK